METWSIEIFDPIKQVWKVELRYYETTKSENDFDLIEIKNKRKNAKIINRMNT